MKKLTKKNRDITKFLIPLLSILIALLIGAILIVIQGKDPIYAYLQLFSGAFSNKGRFGETIIKTIPLIFTGLAVTFAYRCSVFNIGAEGQFMMGALGATWFALSFKGAPHVVAIVGAFLSAFILGAIWGWIPGILKAKRGLNETINTILMNYIAIQVVSFAVKGPLRESNGQLPQTDLLEKAYSLTRFWPGTRVHTGLILALIMVGIVYYYIFWTSNGFRMRVVGLNSNAAEYAGIRVPLNYALALAISGGLAGLGGASEILGIQHRLMDGFSSGFGFDGIAIALISGLHPIGVVFSAFFFGVLRTGANTMQTSVGISTSLVDIVQGLVIFFVLAALAWQNIKSGKIKFFSKKQKSIEQKEANS
ncbi:MAG: ABC transporter permease [Oscillospiraceae bacterium]|nr:ABC transporter permease [Oscillospiraceae bacterium]